MNKSLSIDLDQCAAEPIRIPGAIQPHGALLVVDQGTLECLHVSQNIENMTGLPLKPGMGLDAAAATKSLAAEIRRLDAQNSAGLLKVVELNGRALQVLAHSTPQGMIVEFEPPPSSASESLEGLYPRLRRFLEVITQAEGIHSISQAAAEEIRILTGFNRVLLYRFDEGGDGTVLAEDGDGVLPSYLGLRFPGSDIPQQARELYRLNRIRLIADVDYVPCPIMPVTSPVDGKPIDLSFAALRSVSPVHLEYMRNMGTGSSMSVSIVVKNRLWGLISGHSREPHLVSAQARTACDILGQILSVHIEAREEAERTAERLSLKRVETALVASLSGAASFEKALLRNSDDWLRLTNASGAAVVTAGRVLTAGLTPDESDILGLAKSLHDETHELFATDSMSERWNEARKFSEQASGLLAISISQIHPDYIMWFRPEVVRTVEWSGDPTKPVEPRSDRLHPRRSFELWKEQVRFRSKGWTEGEVNSASDFRNSIQNLVLRRAEERAELTDRLERANKELEAFSYSISHDLRAPFRHIVGYAELLTDRERSLDSKSVHYIASMKDAAISAGRLVDDLLNFSQLGRSSLAKAPVDMEKLIAEVRRWLDPELRDVPIEWTVARLPVAWGDANLIRQVLQNLLGNAVKYSRPKGSILISVNGVDDGKMTTYTVEDNGVGFEMAYAGKLFGVFQRLHRAEEFEGTGIGLALVKRIVERHGGTVAASGEPGRGAKFSFTLPKRPVAVNPEIKHG